MISIVCATNNKEVLNKELKKSLDMQSFRDYELIIVDTDKKKFESAADALNYGGNKAKGDYIIFAHHDIIMKSEKELENIVSYLETIKKYDIIGVAGINSNHNIVGNITNGIPEIPISNSKIDKATEVETIDEVLFIISKETFKENKFLTENKTWHLYAVEYCLKMRELGKKVFVIPSNIYHKSAGASMNKSYYTELIRLCSLYKNKIKVINTTMGVWHTNRLRLNVDIIKVKMLIKLISIKNRLNKKGGEK